MYKLTEILSMVNLLVADTVDDSCSSFRTIESKSKSVIAYDDLFVSIRKARDTEALEITLYPPLTSGSSNPALSVLDDGTCQRSHGELCNFLAYVDYVVNGSKNSQYSELYAVVDNIKKAKYCLLKQEYHLLLISKERYMTLFFPTYRKSVVHWGSNKKTMCLEGKRLASEYGQQFVVSQCI